MIKQVFMGVLVLCILLSPWTLLAQQKDKPALLIYGEDIEAYAAALQSAKSGVSTLWVVPGAELLPSLTREELQLHDSSTLDGGLWMDLLLALDQGKLKTDSMALRAKKSIKPQLVRNAVANSIAQQPQLKVLYKQEVVLLKEHKKGFEVQLTNKHKYAVRAVVDLSVQQQLSRYKQDFLSVARPARISRMMELDLQGQRTLLASGLADGELLGVRLSNMLFAERKGHFDLSGVAQYDHRAANIPFRASLGQAMGALSAYCVFFKTTTDKVSLRLLQAELLSNGARLLPLTDIAYEDPYFQTVQKFGLSGIIPLESSADAVRFAAHQPISGQEIRPVFESLYARSQLWFSQHKTDKLTVQQAIDLIAFVNFRGPELRAQVEKEWSSKLQMNNPFAADRAISRYEFAVLLEQFGSPFSKNIAQDGAILR